MATTSDEGPESEQLGAFPRWLHSTRLWKTLREIPFLRSGVFFFRELNKSLREEQAQQKLERLFRSRNDPWSFETDSLEHERFTRQSAILDSVSRGEPFANGLELGCAEGWYTQTLAERCRSLVAMDLSPTALDRARRRREWPEWVRFVQFDLRRESLPAGFDLIVITAVLEYMPNPLTLYRVRQKLVDALQPGGYLMVETTRRIGVEDLIENSWWGRLLHRGHWINQFIMKHRLMTAVCSVETDWYVISLCRKNS